MTKCIKLPRVSSIPGKISTKNKPLIIHKENFDSLVLHEGDEGRGGSWGIFFHFVGHI